MPKDKTDRRSAKRKCLQQIIDEFGVKISLGVDKNGWNLARRRLWRAIDKLHLFPMRAKKS